MSLPDRVVLDTNVLSYFLERSLVGADYKRVVADQVMCVACITPGELYYGAERRNWGASRRRSLEALMGDCVLLPVSFDIAKLSARIRAQRARICRPIEPADAWIAATALAARVCADHAGSSRRVGENSAAPKFRSTADEIGRGAEEFN